jgi:uncharacterized membrane protein (UPF0127 family)
MPTRGRNLRSPLLWLVAVTILGCSSPLTSSDGSPARSTSGDASAAPPSAISTTSTDRFVVRLGARPLTVLRAGRDGMRGRSDFDGADGMLFDLGREVEPRAIVFVMDGVAFPLDIAWFRADGGLAGTATMDVCPTEPCPRYAAPGPYRYAIEAPVGGLAGLGPTDRLEIAP